MKFKFKTFNDVPPVDFPEGDKSSQEAEDLGIINLIEEIRKLLDERTVFVCDPDVGYQLTSYGMFFELKDKGIIDNEGALLKGVDPDAAKSHTPTLTGMASKDCTVGIMYLTQLVSQEEAREALKQLESEGYLTKPAADFDLEEELLEAVEAVKEEDKRKNKPQPLKALEN